MDFIKHLQHILWCFDALAMRGFENSKWRKWKIKAQNAVERFTCKALFVVWWDFYVI